MMIRTVFRRFFSLAMSAALAACVSGQDFVRVREHQFFLTSAPYYFVGANYWYGSLLGLEKDRKRGIQRLRKELDFLKKNGVTNLRILGGAEGTGLLNGVPRVGPPLQTEQGKFDEGTLAGLDIVLAEMGKRDMKVVIFLSNNWEWSGGFQQYLIWNKTIDEKWLTTKPSWDELRDMVAKFYSCEACKEAYGSQVGVIVRRTNGITGKRYIDDPTIMSWELANEPRPMRPSAAAAYQAWVETSAELIKAMDPHHLVTVSHEGWIGTESIDLFEQVHSGPNVDYLTIHIWPKNWGWFENGKMAAEFEKAVAETEKYIADNAGVAVKLNKPMVIEEFGLPRDNQSFDSASSTKFRDRYFDKVLSHIRTNSHIAGANFWAFGGTARPKKGQLFWKPGDEYMADPPMEEQGMNSVFDSDKSTWTVIRKKREPAGRLPKADRFTLL